MRLKYTRLMTYTYNVFTFLVCRLLLDAVPGVPFPPPYCGIPHPVIARGKQHENTRKDIKHTAVPPPNVCFVTDGERKHWRPDAEKRTFRVGSDTNRTCAPHHIWNDMSDRTNAKALHKGGDKNASKSQQSTATQNKGKHRSGRISCHTSSPSFATSRYGAFGCGLKFKLDQRQADRSEQGTWEGRNESARQVESMGTLRKVMRSKKRIWAITTHEGIREYS